MMKKSKLQKEINMMVNHIIRELIVEFGKTDKEAAILIKKSNVEKSLNEDPLGFHESPYHWAMSILMDNNEVEALENHFYPQQ